MNHQPRSYIRRKSRSLAYWPPLDTTSLSTNLPVMPHPGLRFQHLVGGKSTGAAIILISTATILYLSRRNRLSTSTSPVSSGQIPAATPFDAPIPPLPPLPGLPALPGARDVESPFGTLRVYEWGPQDGRKVLLLHGISTPAVGLGDLARDLVARGCRVLLMGT